MMFSTTFNYIVVVSFIGGGNQRTRGGGEGGTTDLSQVTDKLYHIMIEIRTHNISGDRVLIA